MTRDPHCDGCKADDKLRALREQVATLTAERDAARARLDALCTCPASSMFNGPSAHCPTHGSALSSRPVQPDTERSET